MRTNVRKFITMLASAAVLPASAGLAQASLLTNGSFETPVIAAASFLNIGIGGEPSGFGWTVTTNNVDIISQGVFGWSAAEFDGVQALDLVGFGGTGGIQQTFATAPGQRYELSFEYANNPGPGVPLPVSALVTVTSGPKSLLSQSISHNTSTTSNFNWTAFDMFFTATGASAVVAFNETAGGGNGGVFLDAVSINAASAVPEPSTLFSLAAGGLCLVLARHKRPRGLR